MAKAKIETPVAKHALDPRIRIAAWAVLAFVLWTAIAVLIFIGFGAWLEAIGWDEVSAALVAIFLYLVVWIGVPIVGVLIFMLADERFEEQRVEEAKRQERIAKDEVQWRIKSQIWNDGYQAGGSFWRRKFSDEPNLSEKDGPKNPYTKASY